MPQNDRIILRRVVEARNAEVSPETTFDDFFEMFLLEQVLKKFDLSYDEIESGVVDGGDDGGVDGMYTFVNGLLVAEDTDFGAYKRDVTIDLYIVQAKVTPSFSEKPINAVLDSVKDLLDLSQDLSKLASFYNSEVRQAAGRFRDAYEQLAETFPTLRVTYVYGSFGDVADLNAKVERKAERMRDVLAELFSDYQYKSMFLGARELLQEARRQTPNSLPLRLSDNPISTESGGYLCLVNVKDYFAFISDEVGALRKNIFESNVRDYQGKVEVNAAIRGTLQGAGGEDFWWLNNGITILANNGNIVGKTLTLEDPQIVNGLQTSNEIFNYFSDNPRVDEDPRRVLIRIVTTKDTVSRDKIITATNSQTSLPAASLKAHDQIQRDIEDFFVGHGLYYDRRKNFYKNQGKPRGKIVSIPYLAQAVVAIMLQRPDSARARPSSLLKDNEMYRRVFNPAYPINVFLVCAEIMRAADAFIKSGNAQYSQEERNNLRFHLATYAAATAIERPSYQPKAITEIDPGDMDEKLFAKCAAELVEEFRLRQKRSNVTADRVAKSSEFVADIKRRLGEKLNRGQA